jgi:hypothetical protein
MQWLPVERRPDVAVDIQYRGSGSMREAIFAGGILQLGSFQLTCLRDFPGSCLAIGCTRRLSSSATLNISQRAADTSFMMKNHQLPRNSLICMSRDAVDAVVCDWHLSSGDLPPSALI